MALTDTRREDWLEERRPALTRTCWRSFNWSIEDTVGYLRQLRAVVADKLPALGNLAAAG